MSEARVGAFDAGFQHGVGLFETMTAGVVVQGIEGADSHGESVEAWALHMDEHLERLCESARLLGLSDALRAGALGEAVIETVRRSRLARARVRVTVTAGDLSLLNPKAQRAPDPTVLIVAQPATEYPQAMFDEGVMLALAKSRANPLNPSEGHKSLNYWWRLRELQEAAARGAGEALVLSITNHIASGCVSNVFVVKQGEVLTPPARGEALSEAPRPQTGVVLDHPVLPGIVRGWVISKAEMLGMPVRRRMLGVQDVLEADEVFVTNSSWGVLPVVGLEGSAIAGRTPGPRTLELRRHWLELLPNPAADD